jgi:TonB family protein
VHRALLAGCCAGALLLGAARMARAQGSGATPAPATPAAVVVPPRLLSEPIVPYPEGAQGDAVVVLTLTVNADGSVRTATASAANEPFSSVAVSAAQAFRFSPATRAGIPVAVVIHFELVFREPRPEPEPTAPSPEGVASGAAEGAAPVPADPATSPPSRAPTSAKAIEIEVWGAKLAPAVSSFTRAEVRQLPGAFGDPFRAIESLPGVTPIVSGLPFFYVRGAPPGNVGYFLDGVRVPYLYHVGLGPSIVHPGMVSRVDLYPGGYPAQYGRFAGGIVSGETTLPETTPHGEGNVRIFDAGALAEAGFDEGKGTVLLGGRYSYTAAIVSLLAPTTTLAYHDYQARVSYDLTPRDRVTAFSFGSYDLVGETQNDILTVLFGSEFYRTDFRYEHRFDDASTWRTAVALGFDQTRIGDQRNSQDRMLGVRSRYEHPFAGGSMVRAGFDVSVDGYSADKRTYADPEDPDTIRFDNLFPPRTDQAAGVWADIVWRATPRLELTPGLRADVYGSGGASAFALDPRIAARFKIADKWRIVHAYGIAHQPPSFVVPIPGLTPGELRGGLQSAWQTAAGVEVDLPAETSLKATLFHNAFFDMNDVLGISSGRRRDALDARAQGSAVGLEVYLHRRLTKRVGGYLSYTLSRSTRQLDGYTFPSAFDRTHVASGALAFDLGRRWRLGARLVFYTGVPKSLEVRGAVAPPPAEHPERDPAFYRVDARLEKRWLLGKKAWISFVLEGLNVTLSKETFGTREIGPVTIPSIGLEAGF